MNNFKKIFSQIAKNNNTSQSEVEKEISLAILSAMENPEKSERAEIFWKEFLENSVEPTPQKVIAKITKEIIISLNTPR